MQPTSKLKVDKELFDSLKRTVRNVVVARKGREMDSLYKTDMPESIGIKITNRCNLRCKHCYQWSETGYHHDMDDEQQNLDIDVQIIKNILDETRDAKSRLYLWGGEPMFHRKFSEILALVAADRRETLICTNGLLIDKHMDGLLALGKDLELLFAIEGFEREHDLIRGKGSFGKTMEQIQKLTELREQGVFKGGISVHCVIHDYMIGRLPELMAFFEESGIDFVLLCFPWFISDEASQEMDQYFNANFNWLTDISDRKCNWHGFKYQINPNNVPALLEDLKLIKSRSWTTRIRFQPGLEPDEIESFVRGQVMNVRCADKCLALSTRVDVLPDGSASACKFFSEFTVGNLNNSGLRELWHSDQYDRIRGKINTELTPACSKCSVLYLTSSANLKHI
ncbi:radical SAM protein [Paenibacillus sp. LMG 31461]|uniref:Radical SAM protein n=1 Tax=Paenibacillus plantarum TaxID=2654975 RepID=A0ABX1X7T5_9BACL|nr:radical SAM protein [Paenibacillus plantarum]NOU64055.1 radical SAM protein [Paenibacillus plantarum]